MNAGAISAATSAPTPVPVLYGDSALLIQSYGAVALLSGPLNAPPVYVEQPAPAIRPVEPI